MFKLGAGERPSPGVTIQHSDDRDEGSEQPGARKTALAPTASAVAVVTGPVQLGGFQPSSGRLEREALKETTEEGSPEAYVPRPTARQRLGATSVTSDTPAAYALPSSSPVSLQGASGLLPGPNQGLSASWPASLYSQHQLQPHLQPHVQLPAQLPPQLTPQLLPRHVVQPQIVQQRLIPEQRPRAGPSLVGQAPGATEPLSPWTWSGPVPPQIQPQHEAPGRASSFVPVGPGGLSGPLGGRRRLLPEPIEDVEMTNQLMAEIAAAPWPSTMKPSHLPLYGGAGDAAAAAALPRVRSAAAAASPAGVSSFAAPTYTPATQQPAAVLRVRAPSLPPQPYLSAVHTAQLAHAHMVESAELGGPSQRHAPPRAGESAAQILARASASTSDGGGSSGMPAFGTARAAAASVAASSGDAAAQLLPMSFFQPFLGPPPSADFLAGAGGEAEGLIAGGWVAGHTGLAIAAAGAAVATGQVEAARPATAAAAAAAGASPNRGSAPANTTTTRLESTDDAELDDEDDSSSSQGETKTPRSRGSGRRGRRGSRGAAGRGSGRGGGSLAMEALQGSFHLPVVDAARALGVSTTELKRRCRQLGIRRWPQRKLNCLQKILEEAEEDATLTEDQRQVVRASVERNRLEILADPDAPLLPNLRTLRQVQYKHTYERRIHNAAEEQEDDADT